MFKYIPAPLIIVYLPKLSYVQIRKRKARKQNSSICIRYFLFIIGCYFLYALSNDALYNTVGLSVGYEWVIRELSVGYQMVISGLAVGY